MDKLFTAGLLILIVASAGLVYDRLRPPQLNFTAPPAAHTLEPELQNGPQKITIPSLNIDQAIVPGLITDNVWSVADTSANHLATSATPGQAGNIIVYGHDDPHLFGPLEHAQVGQIIHLTAANGDTHRYQITLKTTTTPNDTSLVQPTNNEILTVYTCTGFANSRRLIIQAQPLPPDDSVDLPS